MQDGLSSKVGCEAFADDCVCPPVNATMADCQAVVGGLTAAQGPDLSAVASVDLCSWS